MRLLFVFFIFLHYLAAPINAEVIGDKSFKDTDWNVPMWNWNNDYLHGQDIEWINFNGDKALQCTLVGGMPGVEMMLNRPTMGLCLRKEMNYIVII